MESILFLLSYGIFLFGKVCAVSPNYRQAWLVVLLVSTFRKHPTSLSQYFMSLKVMKDYLIQAYYIFLDL